MKLLSEKPHLLFLFSIPFIILSGYVTTNEILAINIYDRYFVFSIFYLNNLISILFGLLGFGYWIILKMNIKLLKCLNTTHTLLSLGGVLLIWILAQFYSQSILTDFNTNLTLVIYLVALICIVGQIIYFINIINGLLKKRNKTSS